MEETLIEEIKLASSRETSVPGENWDLVIKPKSKIFDLQLKEVWRYRDLILLFVRRDFVSKYKQTILGPFWFLLGPFISIMIYSIVFNRIASIPTESTNPMLFYLAGLLGWNYFASCLGGTSTTFLSNAGIFGKVYFPRLVTPISAVISNLIQFGIQFMLFIGMAAFFLLKGETVNISFYTLLIPVYLIILAMLALGIGIIISSLTVRYRDLSNFMTFGVQLWMYATPIIYPVSSVPEELKKFVLLNPVAPIIEAFKFGLIGAGSFNPVLLLYSFIVSTVILMCGMILFNRVETTFMDSI